MLHQVLGGWLPVPQPGKLPPDMHIGPVSWVLAAAGLSFGAGMVVSGSCISAHWYRLAEGSAVSPFALVGSALGFIVGFKTWNALYSLSVADAPVVWLPPPRYGGIGGATGRVGLAGGVVVARLCARCGGARTGGTGTSGCSRPCAPCGAICGSGAGRTAGGLAVGLMGALAIVRMRPWGVTATLGSGAPVGAGAGVDSRSAGRA